MAGDDGSSACEPEPECLVDGDTCGGEAECCSGLLCVDSKCAIDCIEVGDEGATCDLSGRFCCLGTTCLDGDCMPCRMIMIST